MAADLYSLLGTAANSLAAHRAATATASHNLQNANTPGYARQRAELVATTPAEDFGTGQIGRGVSLLTVTQARDQFLEKQLPGAINGRARSTAEADVLEAVSALDPDAEHGLASALGNFYASLREMSQDPANRSYRQEVVSNGEALALAFNRADAALEDARSAVDVKVESVVNQINNATKSISQLNKDIRAAIAIGSPPNDLLDIRQRHMDKLAELTGARSVDNGNGTVSMVLPGGTPLNSDFNTSTVSTAANGSNGGHLDIVITPAGSSLGLTVPASRLGGALAGMLVARDEGLQNAREGLDNLAYDFSNMFNGIHRAGYGLDNVNNRNFFTPLASATLAASTITVNAALVSDPRLLAAAETVTGSPGDGRNLLDLISSEGTAITGGRDAGEALGNVISIFGTTTARARATSEQDSLNLENLEKLRESAAGVSIDEELINLTKSQRAYEATMKVITTSDQMLETLMNLR